MNSPDPDHDLLRRCQLKETAALAELIERRQQSLFQLALRTIGGDAALAEEIVVDAFYKIWRNARDWRDGSPSSWMSRIVVRTALDARRSQQRRRKYETNAAALGPLQQQRRQAALDPQRQAEVREEQAQRASAIEQSLAPLPPADRALVHLYYYEERPLAEIALILQITADAAKMRLSRIRQKLRRQQDPAGE
ncbi:RNA polymerase sigma factor [Lignipirellula cremea]|uniref:RNA polymerase sigma factor n=1 Tax=Lignipirellula cremea TaxID=2528010 RepID=UPI0018D226E7|nr:RNA polymerase sigma factor [Lignipirellula cremea]